MPLTTDDLARTHEWIKEKTGNHLCMQCGGKEFEVYAELVVLP